uniref:Uncharacterized protein n=1 Tax=Arundo donax TaxID=35708 RepID=A0A0A8YIV4_ARUDO
MQLFSLLSLVYLSGAVLSGSVTNCWIAASIMFIMPNVNL